MIALEALLGQVSQAVQTAGGTVRENECKQFLGWFQAGKDGGLAPKWPPSVWGRRAELWRCPWCPW